MKFSMEPEAGSAAGEPVEALVVVALTEIPAPTTVTVTGVDSLPTSHRLAA